MKGVACCTLTSVTATLIQYPSQRPHSRPALDLHALWARVNYGVSWNSLAPATGRNFWPGSCWRHSSREIWRPAWCDRRWMYGPRTARPHYISLFYAFHKADLCAIDFLIYSWPSGRSLFADAARWAARVQMSGCNNKKSIAGPERRCALQMDFLPRCGVINGNK